MKRLLRTYILMFLLLITSKVQAQEPHKVELKVTQTFVENNAASTRDRFLSGGYINRRLDAWYAIQLFNGPWTTLNSTDPFGPEREYPFANSGCHTIEGGDSRILSREIYFGDFGERTFTIFGAAERKYTTSLAYGWPRPDSNCPPINPDDISQRAWDSDGEQLTINNSFSPNTVYRYQLDTEPWKNQKWLEGGKFRVRLGVSIQILVPELSPVTLNQENVKIDRFCAGDLITVQFDNFQATGDVETDYQYSTDGGVSWKNTNGRFTAPNERTILVRGRVRIGRGSGAFTGDWEQSGIITIFDPAPVLTDVPDPDDLVVDDLSELNYGGPTTAVQLEHVTCKGSDNGRIILNNIVGNGNYIISLVRQDGTGGALNVTTPDASNPIILPDHADDPTGYENGLPAGTYHLIIENVNNPEDPITRRRECFSDYLISIKEPATNVSLSASSIAYTPDIDVTCPDGHNGRIEVSASAGIPPYSYFLDGSDGSSRSVTGQSSAYTFTGLPALEANGDTVTYTVYVLDALSCRNPADAPNIKFKTPEQLSANAFPSNDYDGFHIKCHGATDNLQVFTTGGIFPHTVNLYNGDNLIDTQVITDPQNAFTEFTDLSAGSNYRITVTSENLSGNPGDICQTIINSISLTEPPPLATDLQQENVRCTGSATGAIGVKASGGVSPYTFTLNDQEPIIQESDSAAFLDLAAGIFELKITDKYNCETMQSIEITEADMLKLSVSTENAQCANEANGAATVLIEGATSPYEVSWQVLGGETVGNNIDVVSSATINTLRPGYYNVRVIDAESCGIVEAEFEIGFNEEIIANITGIPILCEGQVTSLDAGNPGATYEWTSTNGLSSDQQVIEAGESGIYSVTVTGPLGCIDSDSFEITVSDTLISADMLMPTEAYEGDTVIIIDVSYPIPDNISWDWSDRDKVVNTNTYGYAEEFVFTEAGTYTLTLNTFVGGCDKSVTRQILIKERPEDIPNGRISSLGYEEESSVKNFSVYPNPNSGIFSVEIGLDKASTATLTLFSLEWGRLITKKQLSGQDRYHVNFNLPGLPTGTYGLILEVNRERHSKKVFVQ